jgi:hypothetical protein
MAPGSLLNYLLMPLRKTLIRIKYFNKIHKTEYLFIIPDRGDRQ